MDEMKQRTVVMKREAMGEYEEKRNGFLVGEDDEQRKRVMSVKKGSGLRCCQAENCTAELSDAKAYHKRHKVCEYHAKAQEVVVSGIPQRFCQQCSRFDRGDTETYQGSLEKWLSLPLVEKTMRATSASQSPEISLAFFTRPDLLLLKVGKRKVKTKLTAIANAKAA